MSDFLSKLLDPLVNRFPQDPIIGLDVGNSAIKIVELKRDDNSGDLSLKNIGSTATPIASINNNAIADPASIALAIRSIIDANEISAKKVCFSIPGPSVFTKKINIPYMELKELELNIQFEASNYIPQNIEDLKLDFQILSTKEDKSSMEVLIVAVKNEIISGYLEAITEAGLEPLIADVDYFALENVFLENYPKVAEKTVALVDVGAKYTTVNITQKGSSLFTGYVSVGGHLYNNALAEALDIKNSEAEALKLSPQKTEYDQSLVMEAIDKTTDYIASELHRQIGFFWNAASTDVPVQEICLSGAGSKTKGLIEELSSKTGITCNIIEPFKGIECTEAFDEEYISDISPSMGICVGLALRKLGDKKHKIDS